MANKNSKTPRDYSKEYNPPGSREQEERNKRKRDKRKHDKLHGECPDGEELHHTNGIEMTKLSVSLYQKIVEEKKNPERRRAKLS